MSRSGRLDCTGLHQQAFRQGQWSERCVQYTPGQRLVLTCCSLLSFVEPILWHSRYNNPYCWQQIGAGLSQLITCLF